MTSQTQHFLNITSGGLPTVVTGAWEFLSLALHTLDLHLSQNIFFPLKSLPVPFNQFIIIQRMSLFKSDDLLGSYSVGYVG